MKAQQQRNRPAIIGWRGSTRHRAWRKRYGAGGMRAMACRTLTCAVQRQRCRCMAPLAA